MNAFIEIETRSLCTPSVSPVFLAIKAPDSVTTFPLKFQVFKADLFQVWLDCVSH